MIFNLLKRFHCKLCTMWWGHIAKNQFNGQKILPFEKLGKKYSMSFQAFAKCPSHLWCCLKGQNMSKLRVGYGVGKIFSRL
jgi:hypothetical protein